MSWELGPGLLILNNYVCRYDGHRIIKMHPLRHVQVWQHFLVADYEFAPISGQLVSKMANIKNI